MRDVTFDETIFPPTTCFPPYSASYTTSVPIPAPPLISSHIYNYVHFV